MADLIELPDDMALFAKAQVARGDYATVTDVVREAFELLRDRQRRILELRAALDQGIAQLDGDQGIRATSRQLMDDVRSRVGIPRT